MSETQLPTPDNVVVVNVDPEMAPFATEFLEQAKQELPQLQGALQNLDFQTIRKLAHKYRGSGKMFGFDLLTKYGELLDIAAQSSHEKDVRQYAPLLIDYLQAVRISVAIPAKKKILVADDIEAVADFTAHLLQQNGYEVDIANDGPSCLERIAEFKPDLVILDIMMPGIHGIDILKQLKSDPATHSIGVIVFSAKAYKPDQDLVKQLGAFDFVAKPFEQQHMLQIVRRYFDEQSLPSFTGPTVNQATTGGEQFQPNVDRTRPYVRFWGTRGSTPVSGARFLRYGGNTLCLEVRSGNDLAIIDAGTGIRELGLSLMPEKLQDIHLFIGHTHWDHIQGFPFFPPAYDARRNLYIYGASGFGKDLKSVFGGQLDSDYFPVQLSDMMARIEFVHLKENPINLGSIQVFWEYVHHPGAAVGFRIEVNKKKIVYITDNEFLHGYLGSPLDVHPSSELLLPYKNLMNFIRGADILIAESQYLNQEYAYKIGWGHTALSNACLLAKLCGVGQWIITHHDPMHADEFLDEKMLLTKQILQELECPIQVCFAYDGLTLYI